MREAAQSAEGADEIEQSGAPWFLLHETGLEPGRLLELFGENEALAFTPYADREEIPDGANVLLSLADEQIRDLAQTAVARRWCVGLLPHPEARRAMAALGVRGGAVELIQRYREAEVFEADAVTCNGELVFSSVVIGEVLGLRPGNLQQPQTGWSMFLGALRGLGQLRLSPYRLTTAKEKTVSLAALGLVAMGNTQSDMMVRSYENHIGINDGRVSLLALAPRSVLGFVHFLLQVMLPGWRSAARLPRSVALVQSSTLVLESQHGMDYLLDGKPVSATRIEFGLMEGRLRLLPGPALRGSAATSPSVDRESVKLNDIPTGEGAGEMAGKALPLFSHATEEEYRELFLGLRDSATASAPYQVLMVLSVLLALTGLYANSAPVIIGAMILAPLMSPVVSLAMGLARTQASLIQQSLRTLGIGIVWGLGVAVLFSLAMPLEIPTAEMSVRMHPTLLDLLVAIISGIAGAYASAREEIARSLAGVAIAVALVPPLSVAGIGLGWGDWDMAGGAALLFVANLGGIALAGSCTFLAMGFAPFHRARTGVGVTALIVCLIGVPLFAAFRHLVERDAIFERIPSGTIELAGTPVRVSGTGVDLAAPHRITVVLSSPEPLGPEHVDALKAVIQQRVGEPIVLEAELRLRR